MLPLLLGLLLQASSTPTNLTATHVDGQTFLVWDEVPGSGVHYKVYRADQPIRSAGDLAGADVLGTVDDRSSWNRRRSLVENGTLHWILPDGRNLDSQDGLFVHTTASAGGAAYAVTTVVGGVEDTTIVRGDNALRQTIDETPAPPQAVLQVVNNGLETWAHWGGDRDTPFLPRLSTRPSQGYNFTIQRGTKPGPRGLLLRLHAAGGTYGTGFPLRFVVPQGVDILATDDWFFFTGFSFFFGAHEEHPDPPLPGTIVRAFTLQRIKWELDWTQEYLGADHDPERVSIVGGSMGGIGAMYLANEYPEEFAAILCRNANFDFQAPDIQNPTLIQDLWGPYASNLMTNLGLPVYERLNASFMARRDPGVDWPIVRTMNGRSDATVGWISAHAFFEATRETRRPAVHYFDERMHNPFGTWMEIEDELVRRTAGTRRDLPVLRFSDFDQDENPGDGDPSSGDVVGTINGRIEQNQAAALETPTSASFEVYLRSDGWLDDALAPEGRVRLTPRRLSTFDVLPGDIVRFELSEAGVGKDEHLLFADADGLLETPLAPVTLDRRVALFESFDAPRPPGGVGYEPLLFVGDAPLPGEMMQLTVFGPPDGLFAVLLGLQPGSAQTRFGQLLVRQPQIFQTGRLDGNGLANLEVILADVPGISGVELYLQGLIDWSFANRVRITVQ